MSYCGLYSNDFSAFSLCLSQAIWWVGGGPKQTQAPLVVWARAPQAPPLACWGAPQAPLGVGTDPSQAPLSRTPPQNWGRLRGAILILLFSSPSLSFEYFPSFLPLFSFSSPSLFVPGHDTVHGHIRIAWSNKMRF